MAAELHLDPWHRLSDVLGRSLCLYALLMGKTTPRDHSEDVYLLVKTKELVGDTFYCQRERVVLSGSPPLAWFIDQNMRGLLPVSGFVSGWLPPSQKWCVD